MLAPDTLLQNRYLVIRLIAQGGMGAVYQARDQRLGSIIALKETFFTDDHLRKAFEREARLLAGLRHAALPVVSDHFMEDAGQFLIMQYIPGDDLATLLERLGKPFAVSDVLKWGDILLDSLEYLHAQEPPIIHRDIKPQNLKLTERGEIILLDFGLAKGSPQMMSQVTGGGSILGYTPHYAPLEQIQGTGTDPRSDLYSLAATLQHLMTCVTPPDALARASASICGQPDPLVAACDLNPDVPRTIADILMKAMEQNRELRPANAAQMRKAWRAAMHNLPGREDVTIIRSSGAEPFEGSSEGASISPESDSTTSVQVSPVQATEVEAVGGRNTQTGARGRVPFVRIGMAAAMMVIVALALWVGFRRGENRGEMIEASTALKPAGDASLPKIEVPPLRPFTFDLVMLDSAGRVTRKRQGEMRVFSEDLNGAMLDMVEIPGGAFMMGSPDNEKERLPYEGPQHQVNVPPFYMGKFEITQAQWRAVAALPKVEYDLNPSPSKFKGDNLPVDTISWEDATEFCARLSLKTGRAYRLPSEAEWEYACRARTETPFHFGDTITPELVNYNGEYPYADEAKGLNRQKTMPVGSTKMANGFGLFDMHGNLWEWCQDEWQNSYQNTPTDGTAFEDTEAVLDRVLRGGSWYGNAGICRSADRTWATPEGANYIFGFRVALSALRR